MWSVRWLYLSVVKTLRQSGKQVSVLDLYHQSRTYLAMEILWSWSLKPLRSIFFRKAVKINLLPKIVEPSHISFRQWPYYFTGWTCSLYFSLSFLSPWQSKKRFEREWREAERAAQYAEKTDQDINATKADVEKVIREGGVNVHGDKGYFTPSK